MATSSISTTLIPSLTTSTTSSSSSFPSRATLKLSPFPFSLSFSSNSSGNAFKTTLEPSSFASPTRVFAAPEALDSPDTLEPPPETLDEPDSGSFQVGDFVTPGSLSVSEDAEQLAPKHRIRIRLRSYWVPLIEDSCKRIVDAAKSTNAKTMGPVPLPTKKRVYCVLKSPHVHKDARFHFEIRTHHRLIDILYPTSQTIDSLMLIDIPFGVDVEVKL